MPGQDDIHLIREILSGDSASYAELLDKYQTRVYNFAFYLLRSREDAEEVTQDTFVKAFKAIHTFRQEAKFSTWLLRIAYNNSLSRFRKKQVAMVSINPGYSHFEVESINNVKDHTDQEDMRRLLSMALDTLNEDDKAIVTLFYYNEQSIKEICTITGKTDSNIKIILHRSRQKMLKQLKEMGIKEWAS